ncbi:MAG: Gfo/Idh/MocA family oxidoreductase [Opitutaceae bacterium]|nr:Gfo/Idh/MocA family oxidoreductase [Opitutaceae bacterium]
MIRIAIIGAGGRGTTFANIIGDNPHLAKVVAVAEPREAYRKAIQKKHGISDTNCFSDWEAFVAADKLCDAVVVATMDQDHVGPAVACMDKGYHMLLEKPMAVRLEDCQRIAAAQARNGVITSVCHSLRYHKGFAAVKAILDSGRIGAIQTIDHLEQVAFWHQAHSYVRGNWGNEEKASFMLMAKSCHDIDYLTHLIGKNCLRVSSFGGLGHFRKENAPEGATARCTDGCPVEQTCPYSAIKAYIHTDREVWPANVCSYDHSSEAHLEAIRTGPYGRCVYSCDNDVVDHQVVAMEYEDNITVTFTMTAFTAGEGRRMRVHGSLGELYFDESTITIQDFATGNKETIAIGAETGGHGGGDNRLALNWLAGLAANSAENIKTDVHRSLRTHSIAFAAEASRKEQRMIDVSEFSKV